MGPALRQNFEANDTAIQSATLVIFYDEDTEGYANGLNELAHR